MNNNVAINYFPIEKTWENCKENLRSELDSSIFSAYIKPLSIINPSSPNSMIPHLLDSEGVLTIYTPNMFLKNIVEREYGDRIEELLKRELDNDAARISFVVVDEKSEEAKLDLHNHQNSAQQRYVVVKRTSENNNNNSHFFEPTQLNPKYIFDTFVVGNSNEFCEAACRSVAEKPGESYNPLFIYGGVGLGKTHLLHSIGNSVLKRNPSAKVFYTSSEAFTNELIQALRHAKMAEFKSRMRNIEVLLIDDIQFISGKESTQEEFFHTFNALYGAKRQIVMTSDKIPADIGGIEERLQTRFSWGLTADLQSPDFETRVAILRRKATIDQFYLPEDVAHFLAEKISSNVRELEGALTRLHAVSSIKKIALTKQSAIEALEPITQQRQVRLSVDDIKKGVAQHFSMKVSDLSSKKRSKNISFPRHLAMYLCRKHTTASYPEIGDNFGGRDHSSVIHATNVISLKLNDDPSIKLHLNEIERRLLE
jgi:chromosomal replication initiator protein